LASITSLNNQTPKNLVFIRDAITLNPILSNNKEIYGLFQVSHSSSSNSPFDDSNNQAQISFVRQNFNGTSFEACPIQDIQNLTINYLYTYRFNIGTNIIDNLDVDVLDPVFQEALPQGSGGGGSGSPSGISVNDHQTLRQLIHFIDEGPADGFASNAYKEITPIGSIFSTNITWYVDNTKNLKIVEQIIDWNGIVPKTITWKVYSMDGITVAHTVSDSITYTNNIFETSRIRTII
jgi:hypothetical protein